MLLKRTGYPSSSSLKKKKKKSYTIYQDLSSKVTASFPPPFYFLHWSTFDLVSLKAENFNKGGRTI